MTRSRLRQRQSGGLRTVREFFRKKSGNVRNWTKKRKNNLTEYSRKVKSKFAERKARRTRGRHKKKVKNLKKAAFELINEGHGELKVPLEVEKKFKIHTRDRVDEKYAIEDRETNKKRTAAAHPHSWLEY